ncbi:type IV secretion system DotC family protein [Vibrio parahaemolyticus]|uniref:type IV secretory system conjugative DNA transfer family protein n=1 Tax=Vibrio parahaemolyticus TaxID=670 RepID=UPI001869DC48|nr:type IV secretory system conjugative DNA transfer family protein [Vibrio parahaemolyticus]MBE4385039.1 type IV secretion system DotC family protein [Vibrio parahaemolyticus]MEA5230195.1 type IV secretory system conjugative DNA transfer family protein [Vibrio parahaemolyticus]
MEKFSFHSTLLTKPLRSALCSFCLLVTTAGISTSSSANSNIYDYFFEIEQGNFDENSEYTTKGRSSFAGESLMTRGIAQEARSIGMQAGKYWAQQEFKKNLAGDLSGLSAEDKSLYERLDTIYDISPYMLRYKQYYVMPPVVTESNGQKRYKDSKHQTFYIADRAFHIRSEPRFVDAIPTWRDYVRFNAKKPQLYSKNLLPSNPKQKEEWQKNFKSGWHDGVESAKLNLDLQLARFIFDSIGIQRYHILHSAGYITAPEYKTSSHPVSGDDDLMYIGNKWVSISVVPKLEHDFRKWRVIPELPVLEDLLPVRYHQILQYGTGL